MVASAKGRDGLMLARFRRVTNMQSARQGMNGEERTTAPQMFPAFRRQPVRFVGQRVEQAKVSGTAWALRDALLDPATAGGALHHLAST
jgi:hypothetical protein